MKCLNCMAKEIPVLVADKVLIEEVSPLSTKQRLTCLCKSLRSILVTVAGTPMMLCKVSCVSRLVSRDPCHVTFVIYP